MTTQRPREWKLPIHDGPGGEIVITVVSKADYDQLKARLQEAETALRDCINGHEVKDYFIKNSNPTDKK